jgi:hypothetical protein
VHGSKHAAVFVRELIDNVRAGPGHGANRAWQQLSILAHNLIRNFQLDTDAEPKRRSRQRTYTYSNCFAACGHCGFWLSPGPVGRPRSAVARCCDWLRIRVPCTSTKGSSMPWPPEPFSDWR